MTWIIDSWIMFGSSILGALAGSIGTILALRKCHEDNWKMLEYYWKNDIKELKMQINAK